VPRAPIRGKSTRPKQPSAAPSRAPRDGRALAYRALRAVLEDDRNLDVALASELPPRERAFAHTLVATALKRLGEIDAALTPLLAQPFAKLAPDARALLRIGATQMFLDTPPHALVAATVDLAKSEAPHFSGLTNAVLRRLVREGLPQRDARAAAKLNTPDWLWDSWVAAYGDDVAEDIATAHLREPTLDITAREPERWAEPLGAEILPTGSLRRAPRAGGEIRALPGYDEGAWWVQDAAAAMPARLIAGLSGKRVLDLCAAPGGKTAQLVAMGYDVVAVEQSAPRAQVLRDNLSRLKLAAEVVIADATTTTTDRPVDGILLDVPCTATGTIRRHPDIPWRKSAVDLGRLVPVQTRLLDHAATLLSPGGVLVYAVCSLEAAEGPQRIAEFLSRNDDFHRKPITPAEVGGDAALITADGDLRTLPCHWAERGGMDGFYAARLLRR
jgi:16S rRNA (cytosine967-C5)-methyltransferase